MLNIWKKIRFNLGTAARILSSPLHESEIHPSQACTLFGSNFGEPGWHHIRKTLEEYDKNSNINFSETTIYNFLTSFKPSSINEMSSVKLKENFNLFDYPWGSFSRKQSPRMKSVLNSRFCGPSKEKFVEEEYKRTIFLYNKLANEGYKPNTYPHRHITGTWLISLCGEKRFVVMSGNHRMAILAHLGYKKIKVRTSNLSIRKVKESNIKNWKYVKSNFCSEDNARSIFKFFFRENGHHIKVILTK